MAASLAGGGQIFTAAPQEREWQSWLTVILLSGMIFLIIPFVRAVQNFIAEEWGRENFTHVSAAAIILILVAVMAWYVRYPHRTLSGSAVLVGIGGLYGYLIFDLKSGSPEEAIHYILYGGLGILIYRAYAHRVRDVSIYILAILAGTIVGVLDEAIQWAVPGRYFDIRDIWLNLTGVALVQLAIAIGIRPNIISGLPDTVGVRRLCLTGAALAVVLALCHLNTPAVVAVYSERFPALAFLNDQDDAMFEYGHLHFDPSVGSFKSRLTVAELREASRTSSEANVLIIDRYTGPEGFREFVTAYPAARHPFMHEAWVHIQSRDANLSMARDAGSPETARRRYTYAFREHQILEDYYGGLYAASRYPWTDAQRREIEARIMDGLTRRSLVSQHLVTAYSQNQAIWFFCLLIPALFLAAFGVDRMRRANKDTSA